MLLLLLRLRLLVRLRLLPVLPPPYLCHHFLRGHVIAALRSKALQGGGGTGEARHHRGGSWYRLKDTHTIPDPHLTGWLRQGVGSTPAPPSPPAPVPP